MNERIWQLQGQAKLLAEQHIAHRKFDDVMEYRQVLYDTTMNKFAELIVRECIREIGYKSVELLDIDFYPHYQERLKKHFGVEE